MLPVRAEMMNTLSKMCSGSRRSFFCRMKCKAYDIKEEADTTTGSKYTQSGKYIYINNIYIIYIIYVIYFIIVYSIVRRIIVISQDTIMRLAPYSLNK
jgi:hypothetical protein